MRTTIRLTGRRNVPVNAVHVRLIEDRPQRVAFGVRNRFHFNGFPKNSTLKLKLYENKGIETLNLGNRGDLCRSNQTIERSLENEFSRPTCQIRVVQTVGPKKGMLLGTTPVWTIEATSTTSDDIQSVGILKFAVDDLGSQTTWTLEFPESDYPTVYLHKSIPNAKGWVRNDPVFISFVLPAVIRQVFERIPGGDEYADIKWMVDWVEWAKTVGVEVDPPDQTEMDRRADWIDAIVSGFARKNNILRSLIRAIDSE